MHRAQKLCNVVVGGICISSVTLCHFVAPRKPCSTNSCTTWALIFILPSGMGVVTMIPSIAPEFSRCRLSVDMLPDRPSGMSCPRQKYSSANKLRTPFVDARRVPPSQSRNHDICLISVIAWRARLVTTFRCTSRNSISWVLPEPRGWSTNLWRLWFHRVNNATSVSCYHGRGATPGYAFKWTCQDTPSGTSKRRKFGDPISA
jgi:hypothetical protein